MVVSSRNRDGWASDSGLVNNREKGFLVWWAFEGIALGLDILLSALSEASVPNFARVPTVVMLKFNDLLWLAQGCVTSHPANRTSK